MKILVIGSGGREHALCRQFAASKKVEKVFCAPGNAGISNVAKCVEISAADIKGLAKFALENEISITFVGGETSLALGVVDHFKELGLNIIGPNAKAARLEASKAFAKDFMVRNAIPTAKYFHAKNSESAVEAIANGEFGDAANKIVVKADGLAAGKGVVIANGREEAKNAVRALGETEIVLEEFLEGKEVSLLLFADSDQYRLMPPARDHKRIGENNTGANTGGMGTICADFLLNGAELGEVEETIVKRTVESLKKEEIEFSGVLFIGLMMTRTGPRVLEYNVRFGDPEAQSVLLRLETDITDICEAMIQHSLESQEIVWKVGASACVIVASAGYPESSETGKMINGLENLAKDVVVFHSGTKFDEEGKTVTNSGRVLGVSSVAENIEAALANAYAAVEKINFEGMQYRSDIGKYL